MSIVKFSDLNTAEKILVVFVVACLFFLKACFTYCIWNYMIAGGIIPELTLLQATGLTILLLDFGITVPSQ